MADETDKESKTEDASPRKLEDARKKGDVAKSPDVSSVLTLAACWCVIAMGGSWLATKLTQDLLPFIEHPDAIDVHGAAGQAVMQQAAGAVLPTLIAIMAAAAVAGVAGNLIQSGFMWTTDKLKPDFSKLSLMKGLQRIFGIDGLVQFGKSILKVTVVGLISWWVLKPRMDDLANLSALDPAAILPLSIEMLQALFMAVLALLAVTGGFDWFWQRFRFMERMKMSKEEMKEEHKTTEGDPHIKAKLKQKRMEAGRRRMMQNVPKATVVVMNPTHYAVALLYEQGTTDAPKCVAKGLDAVALKIRAVAEEAGVEVIEDPPLARALYAAVEIDEFIPQAHYAAVARIIGFIMQKKNKRQAPSPRLGARSPTARSVGGKPLRPSAL